MVAVKKSGELRVCIDPKPLNAALKREHYQIPLVDDLLPDLTDARVFTKVDLASAFWHLELDEESSMLTTFATPYGDIVGFGYLLVSAFPVKYFRNISIKNYMVFPASSALQMMFLSTAQTRLIMTAI